MKKSVSTTLYFLNLLFTLWKQLMGFSQKRSIIDVWQCLIMATFCRIVWCFPLFHFPTKCTFTAKCNFESLALPEIIPFCINLHIFQTGRFLLLRIINSKFCDFDPKVVGILSWARILVQKATILSTTKNCFNKHNVSFNEKIHF